MSEQKDLVAIAGLTVKFGGLTALDDVHLKVAPNSVVGSPGYLQEYIKKAPYLNSDLDYRPSDLKYIW
jgi:hypothetical protein